MKKICLLMLLVVAVMRLQAQTVKFSPANPVAGNPLSFVYDATGGKLAQLANVKCLAFTFVNARLKRVEIPLTKDGLTYKGTLTPVDSTAFIMLTFNPDGTKDDNPNGYYTKFYQNGKPTAMAHFWESQFYSVYGPVYGGIKADQTKAIAAFEQAFAADPSLKETYINHYLITQYVADKIKGTQLVKDYISIYNKRGSAEKNMIRVASFYNIIKRKSSSDSVYNLVKAKYPKGTYAANLAITSIYSEKDAVKKEQKLSALIRDFKLDLNKKDDLAKISAMYPELAGAYGLAKNNAKFEFYSNKVESKTTRASLYNTYAWASAEAKENLAFATKISKQSIALLESAKMDPVPDYFSSKEEYLKGINTSYAYFADTYAVLLGLQGKYAEALALQEEAVNKNNFSNADMNARYVNFLAKNGKNDQVILYGERFTKDGQGNVQMKADLQAAYKGSVPFAIYYAALEKEVQEREKAKWVKEMINIPAPKFALMNLKGDRVDLTVLKGKVVIIDYWATWCGPCIASFPGMQKAVDKYKNDPNVVFLFINTLQTEENREKVVKDWLATTKYTFNILLDTKNKEDQSKFDVVGKYDVTGIPTKFIVDGNGNIRFKKIGFSGSADGTVKELDMMIELAKNADKPASK